MPMKSLALFAISLSLASAVSAADLKIGVVDVSKAYKEYYKAKDAQAVLQKNAADAAEKYNDRVVAYKKLRDEAESLVKQAKDPVLSDELRAKKAAELQRKGAEIESLNKDMQEYRMRSNQQLQNEDMLNHQKYYVEILAVVQKMAKAAGYDLVFDKSGAGVSLMPILLHSKEEITTDFTSELLIELNKDAPLGSATEKTEEKKAPDAKPAASDKKGSSKTK
jgi:outer membrane protein